MEYEGFAWCMEKDLACLFVGISSLSKRDGWIHVENSGKFPFVS